MSRTSNPDQRAPIHTAIESFSCMGEDGEPIVVTRGMRLRAGDIVARFPTFFGPPDADDIEIAKARAAAIDHP